MSGNDAMPDRARSDEPDDPLATPPADAEQPVHLLWQVAHLLRELHQPGPGDGVCGNCLQADPCRFQAWGFEVLLAAGWNQADIAELVRRAEVGQVPSA